MIFAVHIESDVIQTSQAIQKKLLIFGGGETYDEESRQAIIHLSIREKSQKITYFGIVKHFLQKALGSFQVLEVECK